ncbi:PKD domain-containing protein [Flavobacterium sp. Fl-77]|uniref:PKD domain-containing protein n=1 Tax=Flavobacterium flavipigmentatum TaxID=2893884 RepID=A0AAJ2W2Q8_9FLAO|nr:MULTISPECIES: PKD domain-containing protein [unclassified Flavobacterium]MDX6184052.1 PKD domain-containing protein [Flavobacterium sp. Fl-33]MDX6187630.1 PKD domain-containing protein [Flavobacterium sp. Fl-77]UFH39228.1 PKD domain-containing protein [Flavobacterium sp. F-70]
MNKKNIDIRVIFFFTILLLIGVVAFIIQLFNHVDCEDAKFYIFSDHSQSQESIEFYDKTPNAKSWKWDFGDGSEIDVRKHTFHVYKNPGSYFVTLTINGSCVHTKELIIKDKFAADILGTPKIISAKIIFVGQPTYFKSVSNNAKTWEWAFGENRGIDETSSNPVYTFSTPGEKTITLVINGDFSRIAKKMIYVHPKVIKKTNPLDVTSYEYEKQAEAFALPRGSLKKDPLEDMLQYVPVAPKTKTEKDSTNILKKAPKVSEDQFEILLLKVAEGNKVKDDFAEFLCDDLDIPVVKNDNDLLTFSQLCASIKGKKIRIDAIRLNKDKQNNCVKGLNISYKVKKYMIWSKD